MAGPLILRPAASEVRAMLQKIKMDNRERSRRLAGLVNSCPYPTNPTATTTELIGQSPAFDQATTTAAILRPATLEKWVSLDYTHMTYYNLVVEQRTGSTGNLIFFFRVVSCEQLGKIMKLHILKKVLVKMFYTRFFMAITFTHRNLGFWYPFNNSANMLLRQLQYIPPLIVLIWEFCLCTSKDVFASVLSRPMIE